MAPSDATGLAGWVVFQQLLAAATADKRAFSANRLAQSLNVPASTITRFRNGETAWLRQDLARRVAHAIRPWLKAEQREQLQAVIDELELSEGDVLTDLTEQREVVQLPYIAVQADSDIVHVMRRLYGRVGEFRMQHSFSPMLRRAEEVLWGSLTGSAFKFTSSHAQLQGGEEYENLDELNPFELDAVALLWPASWPRVAVNDAHKRPPAGHCARTITITGGPIGENLIRMLFEYDGSGEYLARSKQAYRLPYTWLVNLRGLPLGSRAVRQQGMVDVRLQNRPAWTIVPADGGQPCRADVDNDGVQVSDFLLVTRWRNFLSREAFAAGKYIVNFAGLHGMGTRAAGQLVRNEDLLNEIADVVGNSHEFQALYRVDLPKGGSRDAFATKLSRVKVTPFPASDEDYDELRRRIWPRLAKHYLLL